MSDKHHRYYKHTKFHQNPRGDPKFLVDLTWNDPYVTIGLGKYTVDHPNRASGIVTSILKKLLT